MGNKTSRSIVVPFEVRAGVSGQDPRAKARITREFSLTEDDLTGFFSAYRMVDVHDRGFARMERFHRYFEIPRTRFYELVLWGEEGPYMEAFTFEEFVFAMERFCGTTRDDLIRLIFRLYDEDKSGFLEMEEFDRLLLDAGGESWVNRFHFRGLFDRFGIAERGFARLRDFEAIAKQFPSLFLHMNTLQREVRERVMGIEWWRRHLQEGGGASNVAAASSVVQTDDAHSVVRRKAKRSKMVTDMRRSMAAQSGPASPLLTAKSQRLLLHRQASASLRDDPPTAGRTKSPEELQELQKQARARGLFGRGGVAEATREETARQLRQLQRSAAQGHVARAMGLPAQGPGGGEGEDMALPRTVSGVKLRRMVTADPRKKVPTVPDRRDEIVATFRSHMRDLRSEWWRKRREHRREDQPSWLDVSEVFEAAQLDREEDARRKEEEDRRAREEHRRAAAEAREREREREMQQMAAEDALAAQLRAAEPSLRAPSSSPSSASSSSSLEESASDGGTSEAASASPGDAEGGEGPASSGSGSGGEDGP